MIRSPAPISFLAALMSVVIGAMAFAGMALSATPASPEVAGPTQLIASSLHRLGMVPSTTGNAAVVEDFGAHKTYVWHSGAGLRFIGRSEGPIGVTNNGHAAAYECRFPPGLYLASWRHSPAHI